MFKKRSVWILATLAVFLLGITGNALAAWGTKELQTEKSAVALAREMDRGNYKLVTTEELKSWMDKKTPMLIVDTMPYEASYKKQHVPGAVQMEFPIPEMTTLDDGKRPPWKSSWARTRIASSFSTAAL